MSKRKKLTARQFSRALKLGHGRALLHVMQHGDAGIEQEIGNALCTSYVWDMTMEGTRSSWLSLLVKASGKAAYYAQCVLKSMAEAQSKPDDQVQLIELSGYFFELGFSDFRPLMFQKFHDLIANGGKHAMCGRTLVDVGGLAGLEFVARTIGAMPDNIDDYDCGSILEHAVNILDEDVASSMEELARQDRRVRVFTQACERHETSLLDDADRARAAEPKIEDVLATIRRKEKPPYRYYQRFGKKASAKDIDRIFVALRQSQDSDERKALLQVFHDRELPTVDAEILELLNTSDADLRQAAATAIARLKSASIRRKAITLLNSTESELIPIALELLDLNYRSSDEPLVMAALKRIREPEHVHSAGLDVLNITENVNTSELADCILWLYENGPESWCRSRYLQKLIDWDKCPEDVLFESQWDAGSEVQMVARGILTARERPSDKLAPKEKVKLTLVPKR